MKSQLTASRKSQTTGEMKEPHKERNRLQSSWLSFSNYWTRSNGANGTDTYQLL